MKVIIELPKEDIDYVKENEDLCNQDLQRNIIKGILNCTPITNDETRE